MRAETKTPFVISCILHGALFLAVLVSLLFQTCTKPKQSHHVFTVVSESVPDASMRPALEMPEIAVKMPERKPPPVAEPVKPKPAPAPVKKMSYAEFVKKEGKPKPRAPRKNKPKQVAAPKLNVGQLTAQLEQVLVHDDSGKTVEARFPVDYSALNAYIAKVRERLDASWKKPEKLAALHPTAVVEFSVEANGHLSGVRIVQASGYSDFDNSVLRAFSQTNNLGSPPEPHRYTLRLTFKMLDH
tara:strand:- start:48829 stop:49557 length:729 start_codon:yes stop_codon:yes gene_type:complete